MKLDGWMRQVVRRRPAITTPEAVGTALQSGACKRGDEERENRLQPRTGRQTGNSEGNL